MLYSKLTSLRVFSANKSFFFTRKMLYGLGFRLCYYRRITVQTDSPVSLAIPPSQTNCTEFVLDKQIVTVTCGADNFNDVTTHGFLSLFILVSTGTQVLYSF